MNYWHRAFKNVYYGGNQMPTMPEHWSYIQNSKGWIQCDDRENEKVALFPYRCLLDLMRQHPEYDDI